MDKSNFNNHAMIALKDIAVTGLMVATIEVAKMALAFLPNIELTSFFLILYTLTFGRKTAYAVPVFVLIEGAVYGFNVWWIMYLYAWPLLVLLTHIFKKNTSVWFWSVFSGIFGLLFGALCSIPYFFIGWAGGTVASGIVHAATWWIAGIPFDIIHCIGNFTIMLVLYIPTHRVLQYCYRVIYSDVA